MAGAPPRAGLSFSEASWHRGRWILAHVGAVDESVQTRWRAPAVRGCSST